MTARALMNRTRRRMAGERGYVIVFVLALIAIVIALGAAAIAEVLSSRQLTTHDLRARRAQQAADSGIQSQLYTQSEANLASSYNFSGGTLGLSNFIDCLPLQLNANLQVNGVTAYASSAGVCPSALTSTGGTQSSYWNGLDNHGYYEAEYFSNKKEVGGSGFGSVVEFPEIVSIGCDSATASTCSTTPAPSSNVYARELALLQPTGPVQAIEGMGNVTINGLTLLGINTAAVVDGDVMAGGTLSLPAVGIATDTNWPAGSSILPTFGYGATPAPTSITTAHIVHLTGGFCTLQSPSTSCLIKRPAPGVTIPSTATLSTICASCATGITCSSCGTGGYNSSTDTFSLTAGTASFAAGDYYLCNFNATGGTVNTSPSSSTPVRIFILPPNQAPCSGDSYTQSSTTHLWSGGNFNASTGLNNALTGSVNGVAGALDPSGLQIYDEGDGSYDNYTTVSIGDSYTCTASLLGVCTSATAPTESMVVYAPTSAVTVSTGSCVVGVLGACTLGVAGVFDGSIVGDNVTTTAAAITQDLDIGNYPIESGANALRVAETVQCDGSVTSLSNNLSTDTGGC